MRSLKLYNLNTPLDFGMYNGDNLYNVFAESPDYIYWCLSNVAWFVIDQTEFDEKFPLNALSRSMREAIENKWNQYMSNAAFSKFNDHNLDYKEPDSYGEYSGSYAQDVEGLSDNFINDVLGSEPDAYWNID